MGVNAVGMRDRSPSSGAVREVDLKGAVTSARRSAVKQGSALETRVSYRSAREVTHVSGMPDSRFLIRVYYGCNERILVESYFVGVGCE